MSQNHPNIPLYESDSPIFCLGWRQYHFHFYRCVVQFETPFECVLKVKAGVCVQDHGLFAKERAEEQPRPPVKANDYSSSSESSESSEESESGEGAEEEESPTDR